jgi:hypothetical protein
MTFTNGNHATGQARARRAGGLGFVALLAWATPGAAVAEERLFPPLVLGGEVGDGAWVYGQINKGFLVHDDGDETELYPLVDNAASSTRLGLWLRTKPAEDFTLSANLEGQWNPYSTFSVNRLNKNDVVFDLERSNIRKVEVIMALEGYGTVWIGQGSTASDGSSEQDLSGTALANYASVADMAGGQLFVEDGGAISDVAIGDAFSHFDGMGRLTRFRYDTPTWNGLGLASSVGFDAINSDRRTQWDIAALYAHDGEAVVLRAKTGFAIRADGSGQLSGSISALHNATGLNLTLAAGGRERDGDDDPMFGYAKLGWKGRTVFAAPTAVSVDVYAGDDIATGGSESHSFGLGLVQPLRGRQTELYAGLRWHEYDDASADYQEGLSFLTGARFRF